MEVSALKYSGGIGLHGRSALLRLQSDERLIAYVRKGNTSAFEVLISRYESRLLAFCRHLLGSREDAEDVLQEVFAAAFNAVLADERDINVRPWLYRIARNRSLNHLRRNSPIGVDSMDVHFAEHGMSTGDRAIRRESFRELLADVQQLPETQRTALLLREIDALSYDQIAHAMETTVPSVKSLLVRARISLAEAAEARKLTCEEVRLELGEAAEGLSKLSPPARRHVRGCERCGAFKKHLKDNNHALAAILPVGPLLLVKKLFLAKLGSTASAGGAHVAGGAGATMGVGAAAGASATGGGGIAGGILTAGAGALATKAVAGLAAAAIVTAGVAAADHPARHHHHLASSAAYAQVTRSTEPRVVEERPQPVSSANSSAAAIAARRARHLKSTTATKALTPPPTTPTATAALPEKPAAPKPTTQVTTETTELPAPGTVQGVPADPAPTSAAPVTPPLAGPEVVVPTAPPVAPVESMIPTPTPPEVGVTPPTVPGGETPPAQHPSTPGEEPGTVAGG